MPGLSAPVEASARGFSRTSERRTDHHCVRTTSNGLGDVAAAAYRAIGDHVDVTAARFVEIVATGSSNVGDGRGHRHGDAENRTRRVGCSAAKADENAGGAAAHQMKGGLS